MEPQPTILRAFSPAEDIPGVLSLYAEVEAVDHAGMEISEQALRSQLEFSGHDPLKDRWVVEARGDPACLVGSALVRLAPGTQAADANIVVHPGWRQRGIGSQLLAKVSERARVQGASVLEVFAAAGHPGATGFVKKHGFTPQGAYTELRLPHGTRLPPVIWPFGYTMQPYAEVQNLATLTEAMNLCYVPLWGHHPVSEQEMASWLPGFNQQGLFLVFSEKGRVVGISRTEPSPERTQKNGEATGYIDAPGVVPQHRRLDLYRALVLTGIRWLYEQGQSLVEMESWGDKLEVLKMYRELGFKDIRQRVCYQKVLAGEGDG